MAFPDPQLNLFGARIPMASADLPEGMRFQPEIVSPREEATLLSNIADLDLSPFAFHGFFGKRRTAAFGWRYDFNGGGLQRGDPIPSFLAPLRDHAARFAGLAPVEQVLVSEYRPGAGIGWHRDKPHFGIVVAFSLASACRLRFRKAAGKAWERKALSVPARSAYLLDGSVRQVWELDPTGREPTLFHHLPNAANGRRMKMRKLDSVIDALDHSAFRQHFCLGQRERAYLQAKGMEEILRHARDFIDRRLAPAQPR